MEDPRPPDFNTESLETQAPIWKARRPEIVSELLTAREAIARFPGLYYEKLYALAARGLLHPVKPQGRILYPEWELKNLVKIYGAEWDLTRTVDSDVVKRLKHRGIEFEQAVA